MDSVDADEPILHVDSLQAEFPTSRGPVRAANGISFSLRRGETLGILGESGSGKSATALSLIGLLPPPGMITGGRVLFKGRDLVSASERELQAVRGSEIAMIFQDPMTSLNPVFKTGWQVGESLRLHRRLSIPKARSEATRLFERVGIADARNRTDQYPHEFSGGMRQRAMIAMGLANNPSVLIADEPTTALDVTIQAQILDLLRQLNRSSETATILITHNFGAVAGTCERVIVMYAGRVVEQGPTVDVFAHPAHPYTWSLLRSVPRLDAASKEPLRPIDGSPPDLANLPAGCKFHTRCPLRIDKCMHEEPELEPVGTSQLGRCWVTQDGVDLSTISFDSPGTQPAKTALPALAPETDREEKPLLEIRGLKTYFPVRGGLFRRSSANVRAVDGVDLVVRGGETIGLVGESGCGKTTLGRTIVRLTEPTEGEVWFEGRELTALSTRQMRAERRKLAMIFQDPFSSLDSRQTVGDIIAEPLQIHDLAASARARHQRVDELLAAVGLSPTVANRYPHQFSGGERQRIGIARALAVEPTLIVCDEPVAALDVSIQAQIITLLERLQQELRLTYLFIAHDLAVARHISDRIAVMYLGKIVEIAPAHELYRNPKHPFTAALISAIPLVDPAKERSRERIILKGEVPSPVEPPSGCRFRTRCFNARERCALDEPPLDTVKLGEHEAACFFPVGT